jgi:hypothetical protein
MRVNPNSEPPSVAGVSSPAAGQQARLAADQVSCVAVEALNRALESTPVSRPDKVAEARKRIEDTNYPPLVMIRKIAELIAPNINPPSSPA